MSYSLRPLSFYTASIMRVSISLYPLRGVTTKLRVGCIDVPNVLLARMLKRGGLNDVYLIIPAQSSMLIYRTFQIWPLSNQINPCSNQEEGGMKPHPLPKKPLPPKPKQNPYFRSSPPNPNGNNSPTILTIIFPSLPNIKTGVPFPQNSLINCRHIPHGLAGSTFFVITTTAAMSPGLRPPLTTALPIATRSAQVPTG